MGRIRGLIASEGVLDGYAMGSAAKLWEDLEKFVGITVPVTLEHPTRNGNPAFIEEVPGHPVVGEARIIRCPSEEKALCAIIDVDPDTPMLGGYSIGYGFDIVNKSGEIGGERYDFVQRLNEINHVAITAKPRNRRALILADAEGDQPARGREFYMFETLQEHNAAPGAGAVSAEDVGGDSSGGPTNEETEMAENTKKILDLLTAMDSRLGKLEQRAADQAESESEEESEEMAAAKKREEDSRKRAEAAERRLADSIRQDLATLGVSGDSVANAGLEQLEAMLVGAKAARAEADSSVASRAHTGTPITTPAPPTVGADSGGQPAADPLAAMRPGNYQYNPIKRGYDWAGGAS